MNVFLGLGMPWTLGALYWILKDSDEEWSERYPEVSKARNGKPIFVVPATNLRFSVLVFTCCAAAAFLLIYLRRKMIGAELGGPFFIKVVNSSALIFLWLVFIVLSSWQAIREDDAGPDERWAMMTTVIVSSFLVILTSVIVLLRYKAPPEEETSPTEKISEHGQEATGYVLSGEDPAADCFNVDYDMMDLHDDCDRYKPLAEKLGNGGADEIAGPLAVRGLLPPSPLLSALVELSPPALQIGTPMEAFTCDAFDGAPVQPFSTPSMPPLLAEAELNSLSQAQLFAHSMQVWHKAADPVHQSPIVNLPNDTRGGLFIEQHGIGCSPPMARGVASPSSPARSPGCLSSPGTPHSLRQTL